MKRKTIKAMLWTIAGLAISLAVLLVVLSGFSGQIWITDSDGIRQAADQVLTCVHDGSWEELSSLVSGNPQLQPQTGEAGTPENLIWNAYCQSLQWSCADTFELQGSQITQKVTVTCLDIAALTRSMTEILGESTDYTERDTALLDIAQQVLDTQMPVMQKELTLSFIRNDSRWTLIPNNSLLALLSGFTGS